MDDRIGQARKIVDMTMSIGPIVREFRDLVSDDIDSDYDFYCRIATELGCKPTIIEDWERCTADDLIRVLLPQTTPLKLARLVRKMRMQ